MENDVEELTEYNSSGITNVGRHRGLVLSSTAWMWQTSLAEYTLPYAEYTAEPISQQLATDLDIHLQPDEITVEPYGERGAVEIAVNSGHLVYTGIVQILPVGTGRTV